jgi:hypothetical protein
MNIFNLFSGTPVNLPGGEIRMIGDRGSGKTCYLSALSVCWAAEDYNGGRILSVSPFGDGAIKLQDNAKNCLENGIPLPPSEYADSCRFSLLLNPRFLMNPIATLLRRPIRLNISITAPTGELIENLVDGKATEEAFKDCASVAGLMIIISGIAEKEDEKYAKAIATLQKELNRIIGQTRNRKRLKRYRIAVVFTKGEQSGVLVHRHDSRGFAENKFPDTTRVLENWKKTWNCSMNFFICSAFGMIRELDPNCRSIGNGRFGLREPNAWQPFGLVAPIYWLQTGKDDRQLRGD